MRSQDASQRETVALCTRHRMAMAPWLGMDPRRAISACTSNSASALDNGCAGAEKATTVAPCAATVAPGTLRGLRIDLGPAAKR